MRTCIILRFFLVVVLGSTVVGCMSLEQMAPSVGPQFESLAIKRDIPMAFLESGRQVYLVDCSRCHSIEPIHRYSTTRWQDIIPRMAHKSKLDHSKSAALRAYILAVSDLSDGGRGLN